MAPSTTSPSATSTGATSTGATSTGATSTDSVREACHRAIASLSGRVLPYGSPHADYAFGVVSYLAADLGEAVTSLARADASEPSARAAYALGLAHAACGQGEQAAAAFLRSVEIAPELLEGYYQAATALRTLGRGAEATAFLRQGVERFRGTSWASYLLNEMGVNLQLDGDAEAAERSFRESIAEAAGDSVAPRTNLALVLERSGRTAEARQLIEQVMEETRRRAAPHARPQISFLVFYLLGNLELADGHPLRACQAYERSLVFLPHSASAWNSLAVALHAAGRRRQAERALRRALAADPGFHAARRNLESLNPQGGPG